jgi:hypothetical protein
MFSFIAIGLGLVGIVIYVIWIVFVVGLSAMNSR